MLTEWLLKVLNGLATLVSGLVSQLVACFNKQLHLHSKPHQQAVRKPSHHINDPVNVYVLLNPTLTKSSSASNHQLICNDKNDKRKIKKQTKVRTVHLTDVLPITEMSAMPEHDCPASHTCNV